MGEGYHFYNRRAEPRHEVNGRPSTVRDARKYGWVPSSTTILGVYPKIGLDISIQNRLMDMAAASPRDKFYGLTDHQWRGMIRELQRKDAEEAARIGTIYHAAIESMLADDDELPEDANEIPAEFFPSFREWWKEQKLEVMDVETTFVHPLGYGGTIDCIAQDADGFVWYIDWKTQDTSPDKGFNFWHTYALQLESYARGDQEFVGADYPGYGIKSVCISRTEPGRIESKNWEDHDTYWNEFLACLTIWKSAGCKNYDPSWEEK